jgi:hypothetical protein
VSSTGGDPHEPFRTDGPPAPADQQPTESPPAPSSDPPPDPVEQTAQVRAVALRLAIVSVAAVAAAFFAPPVGAVLGVVTLVLALRSKGSAPPRIRTIAIVAGTIAVVVGVAITVLFLVFRTEFTDYQQCIQGANTRQAEQNCQDAVTDSLTSRLGL